MYIFKTPLIFRWIFPRKLWGVSGSNKVYLTFDDGPTPEITEFVLSELKKYNAKATFFCIGKNIKNHTEIFQQIIENGHTIGNHTQNHVNGFKTNTNDYLNNFLDCEKIISKEIDKSKELKIFRPPYGKILKRQAEKIRENGYKIIMYDVLSADFDKKITKEQCLQNVLKNTKKGSIIVFHDSVKASENLKFTLPKVLDYYSKKGFDFKAIHL